MTRVQPSSAKRVRLSFAFILCQVWDQEAPAAPGNASPEMVMNVK